MFYATLPKSPEKKRKDVDAKSEGSKNAPNQRIKSIAKTSNQLKLKVGVIFKSILFRNSFNFNMNRSRPRAEQ